MEGGAGRAKDPNTMTAEELDRELLAAKKAMHQATEENREAARIRFARVLQAFSKFHLGT